MRKMRCFAKCDRFVTAAPKLTSFIGHDDDDRFRTVSLRVEHAQGHQVLRVRLQPRQRVLLQRQQRRVKTADQSSLGGGRLDDMSAK